MDENAVKQIKATIEDNINQIKKFETTLNSDYQEGLYDSLRKLHHFVYHFAEWVNSQMRTQFEDDTERKVIRENRSVEHGDSDDWCDRGCALLNNERYEEAMQVGEKMLELNPNHSGGWGLKGIALDKLGRYEEALQAYDKALELYPDYCDAWIGKLDVLHKLGRGEEAQRLEEDLF